MKEIIKIKVKKKYDSNHNKKIKYLPYKYEESLCLELKSKLDIYEEKNYYGFIPYYNKFPKEEALHNNNPIYLNKSYFYVRDRKFFKIVEKTESDILDLFLEVYPSLKENVKEKHFINIGKVENVDIYLVRVNPVLLSNGISFNNIPPKNIESYAWQTHLDFYFTIKNSKKKIYKQILDNEMNYHLKNKFYPDLNIQQKEILFNIELGYIYSQIIGSNSPESKLKN